MTLRLIPANPECDYWGPRGMAHCVWLLTFEHPSDLPLVYEWFGHYWDCVTRLYDANIISFYALMFVILQHHAFEPSTRRSLDAYRETPFPKRRC